MELFTEAGGQYEIVAGLTGLDVGAVTVFVFFSPQAVPSAVAGSDGFAFALPMMGAPAIGVVNNGPLGSESYEPRHFNSAAQKTAWWKWTAPWTGRFTVKVEGPAIRTGVAVYVGGSFTALQLVASDASSTAGIAATASFTAIANTEYRVVVDSLGLDAGNLTLRLDP